jgi:uncharacterized glyoxalase superfamily protein PhnB
MKIRSVTPVLNVVSVPESFAWFEALGWTRTFSWNEGGIIEGAADRDGNGDADFGGVCAGDATIFLCQDGQGSRVPRELIGDGPAPETGVWMSWWVESPDDVDACHAKAAELGYHVPRRPADEPWGVREFHLVHPDGHTFRVSSAASASADAP